MRLELALPSPSPKGCPMLPIDVYRYHPTTLVTRKKSTGLQLRFFVEQPEQPWEYDMSQNADSTLIQLQPSVSEACAYARNGVGWHMLCVRVHSSHGQGILGFTLSSNG